MDRSNIALEPILQSVPVVPVLIIDDVAAAVPLARALVAGGLKVLEITLRTEAALEATKAIIDQVEGAITGLGTVLNAGQMKQAEAIGAAFMVSPGGSPALLDAADDCSVPLLPGAATAGEAMTLLERGYALQKFFPAEQAGGAPYLKSLSSPLAAIRFCPTGGISPANADTYLSLPNVICVGGSWVAPADAVLGGDWARIEDLARIAGSLNAGEPA
jgi:2-dehydro-3-deoxyphosphogluconate aldolase/(4S)-4-hydroxy-2-oxoglutarate aldolase